MLSVLFYNFPPAIKIKELSFSEFLLFCLIDLFFHPQGNQSKRLLHPRQSFPLLRLPVSLKSSRDSDLHGCSGLPLVSALRACRLTPGPLAPPALCSCVLTWPPGQHSHS